MEALYDIPVIGLVIQFVVYVLTQFPVVAPIIVGAAVPVVLGALCGFMNERTGVVNIGIEGMMLIAAFTAWWGASLAAELIPIRSGPLGITPALLIGLAAGIGAACLTSALHAWLSISVRADQIISGTIINLFAFGVTGYLNYLISATAPPSGGQFGALGLPDALTDLPVIGVFLDSFIAVGPIALTMLISVILLQFLLHRSRWGLRTRAVGEHPRAAETVGIGRTSARLRRSEDGTRGVDGRRVPTHLVRLDSVALGGLQFGGRRARIADLPVFASFGLHGEPALLVGTAALEGCVVRIAYQARRVRLCDRAEDG